MIKDCKSLIESHHIYMTKMLEKYAEQNRCDSLEHLTSFDGYTNENKTENNIKWPYIPDYPYRILIVRGSELVKTNALINLINIQPKIDKICVYTKDPYEAKHQYLNNKRDKVGLRHYDDHKVVIE